jgi:multicomponent Na+:H+ antiporter subunit B
MSPAEQARPPGRQEGEPIHRPIACLVVVAGMAIVLAFALLHLPREGAALAPVARYAMTVALPKWKTTEPVNEVVYGTRGFDTFGETFILLAAVVGVLVLTRPREARHGYIGEQVAGAREQSEDDPSSGGGTATARQAERQETATPQDDQAGSVRGPTALRTPDWQPLGGRAPERAEAMTVVVRVAVRVVSPLLAIAGIYTVAWGYSPGGGFPGGAVLSGVVLLVYAGFGYRKVGKVVRAQLVESVEFAGALAIICCETLGLVLKGSFSANWLPLAPAATIRSGGILQVFSGSEMIEVASGLVLAVVGILAMTHDWTSDEATETPSAQSGSVGGRS